MVFAKHILGVYSPRDRHSVLDTESTVQRDESLMKLWILNQVQDDEEATSPCERMLTVGMILIGNCNDK